MDKQTKRQGKDTLTITGDEVEVFCKISPDLVEQLLQHLAGTPHIYTQVHSLVQALLKVRETKTTAPVPEQKD